MGRPVRRPHSGGKDPFVIFIEIQLQGAYIIEPEKLEDERGFFARSWCEREFDAHNLNPRTVQCNISFNSKKGTLRGMHYQAAPRAEAKLVRCTRGAIYDVVIDLRPESPTLGKWYGIELTPGNGLMVYAPEGFAHGFQTLEDSAEVFYQISEFHAPECARGVRWNDPAFAIEWPISEPIMLKRDRNYPDFVA